MSAPNISDLAIGGGGDFAAGKGPVHYGSGPLTLQTNEEVRIDANQTTTQHTWTFTPRTGAAYSVIAVGRSLMLVHGHDIQSVSIDAADSNVAWQRAPHGTWHAEGLGVIQASQLGSWSVSLTGTGGVELLDGAGFVSQVQGTSGGVCPATGVARAFVTANSSAAISLSDGTTTKTVGTGDGASWILVTWPCVEGVTYTLSGTGIHFLGGSNVYVVTVG